MSPEMTAEEFKTKIVVDAVFALEQIKLFRAQVEQAKRDIKDLSQQSGQNFRVVGTAIKSMVDEGMKVKAVTQAMRELNQETKQSGDSFSGLGTVGQFVFGSVLGITAVTAIRKIIDLLKQAAEAGIEFSRANFQLEVGVRALQRIGMDTTLEVWREQISKLGKEFKVFSTQELTQGIAVSLLKLREFGFTEQQIKNTQRMAATLSLLTGKDFTESIQGVTYALGSGYFEALQRAGIQISRTIVAQEALKRGYEGGYQSLDDNIRAQLTYDIIMRQIVPLTDDAAKVTDTLAGKVTLLGTAWENLLTLAGDRSSNLLMRLADLATGVLNLARTISDLSGTLYMGLTFLVTFFQNIGKGITESTRLAMQAAQAFRETYGIFMEQKKTPTLGNAPIGTPEAPPEVSGEAIMSVFGPDIEKEMKRILELEEDFQQDLEKIDRDGAARRKEIWDDYWDKIVDISLKANQKLDDEKADYERNVAKTIAEFAQRRAEIEMRYRNNEITAEARFQERLRQLREGFLMSLEDAVHERDARQVIRLTKQYNLQKGQMIREEKLRKDEAYRAYQLELQMLAMERAAKLRNLEIEHQARMAEIKLQADRESAQAATERERQLLDLTTSLERQKAERRIRHGQQMDDLREQIKERLALIAEKLAEEESITIGMADAIYQQLKAYYGEGGYMEELYTYFYGLLVNMAKAAAAATGGLVIPPGSPGGGGKNEENPPFAEGGWGIAMKPTTATFGEAGPEAFSFIPLNRAGVNVGKMRGGSMPAGMNLPGGGGKVSIDLKLSPDLEYRIRRNALDDAANVILSVERERG